MRPSPLKVTVLHVMSFDNGRTSRASLQRVTRIVVTRLVRPSPLKVTVLHVMSFDNGRTDRASLQRVTRIIATRLIARTYST